jgi:hypothetical protein
MSGDHLADELQMAGKYLKQVRQIGCEGVKWIEMAQDRIQRAFMNMVIYLQVLYEAGNVLIADLRYIYIYIHNTRTKRYRKRISRRPNINK